MYLNRRGSPGLSRRSSKKTVLAVTNGSIGAALASAAADTPGRAATRALMSLCSAKTRSGSSISVRGIPMRTS